MSILDRAELLLQAKNYSGSGDWLDESGNGHDAQLGSTSGADTNDPLFKPWDGTDYLYLPGSASNYASTPDVNLLDANSAHFEQALSEGAGPYGIWGRSATSALGPSTALTPVFGTQHIHTTLPTSAGLSGLSNNGTGRSACSPSTEYTFTVSVSRDTSADVNLTILDYNAGGSAISTLINTTETVTAGEWTILTATFTTSGTAATLRIDVRANVSTAGQELYVDAACLRTGSDGTFVPSLRIVGDLDIEAKIAATDWTSVQTIFDADVDNGSNKGYMLYVTSDLIAVHFPVDGSANRTESSNLGGLTDGEPVTVRWQADVSAGTGVWLLDGTQVDTDTFTAGAIGVQTSGNAASVGATSPGTSGNFAGDIYYVIVRDGIDGPIVAEYRASDASEPFATHTGAQDGRTWTHNRSASGLVSTVVDRDMFLLTTDDYMVIADDDGLDFNAGESFTLMAVTSAPFNQAYKSIVGKGQVSSSTPHYTIFTNLLAFGGQIADSDSNALDEVSGLTLNQKHVVALVRDGSADTIEMFLDGSPNGTVDASGEDDLRNSEPLYIGRWVLPGPNFGNYYEGTVVAVALFREALTDAEILVAGNELIYGVADSTSGNLLVLGLL